MVTRRLPWVDTSLRRDMGADLVGEDEAVRVSYADTKVVGGGLDAKADQGIQGHHLQAVGRNR